MNDSERYKKGQGFLASTHDLQLSAQEFAIGCILLQATALGDTKRVQSLLRARPRHIYFRDYDRRTALHVASSEGKLDIVKMLIEQYNSPFNRSDRWGGSPLDDAHRHRHTDVVRYLRSKGATTGTLDQGANLIRAAAIGDLDELRMLLSTNDISSSSSVKTGMTTQLGIVPETMVDVNSCDYDKRTALHVAAASGNYNVIHFLISRGADVNIMDNWGGRPLDDAIRNGSVECIKILTLNGAICGNGEKHMEEVSENEMRNSVTSSVDENLRANFSELEMIEKIGQGAFGEIYKCRWRGTLVAAKCIRNTKILELWALNDMNLERSQRLRDNQQLAEEELKSALEDFRLETSILRTLRHPNICMLLAYSQTENFEVMISELMKCSLLDIFKANLIHNTKLTKKQVIIYAQQLSQGMNYLHSCKPPIIHRDLKPANLLIDHSGTLKISDFGLAKVRPDPQSIETDKFRMTGETGSYRYMAPEVFRHEEYTETVDIYSFSMIFYYLLSGKPPWPTLNGLKVAIQVAEEADRPVIDRAWDAQISSLLQRCWDENPNSRPSFSQILKELAEYSKDVLHVDMDNMNSVNDDKGCSCLIS